MNSQKQTTEALHYLISIISKLRDPIEGCPWDKEQTHDSLIPYVIEEAYEVADAIRQKDDANLKEELGDLLLQVLMHAEIASKENRFYLKDIIDEISSKLIRRHPHVFKKRTTNTSEEINQQWEIIKEAESYSEKSRSPISDRLKVKIRSQPALSGAMSISKRVARLGFGWESLDEIWSQMDEELKELKSAIKKKDYKHAEKEIGDVIFTIVNIARCLNLNPEEGLTRTNKRFLNRLSYIENTLKGSFSEQSIKKLQALWQLGKTH